MSQLSKELMVILRQVLDEEFVPHLPPLLNPAEPVEKQITKNQSRAFAAFALHHICGISKELAAKAVVDDSNDGGIDAIFYDSKTETLYFVQSKIKQAVFSQEESLKFCNGMRNIIGEKFEGFNQNILNRQTEIEGALRNCNKIEVVIAHTGSEIGRHAKQDFDNFLLERTHGEERLNEYIIDFDSEKITNSLQQAQAFEQVDANLFVNECSWVDEPRKTYFGLVKLKDLIDLHNTSGEKLYQKNIRTFIRRKTDVNTSIQQTLAENPSDFVYLNNGVTALCQEIRTSNPIGKGKTLRIKGISVINGAQTIGSSAKFLADYNDKDISAALVLMTFIKADANSAFGDLVTRTRNHQNKVLLPDFVALDEQQERLRRDIAYLKIEYIYKAGVDRQNSDTRIYVEEAAQALSVLQNNSRFAVLLKRKSDEILDRDSEIYKALFNSSITAFQLVNAVRFNRYLQKQITNAINSALNAQEESIYRNGNYIVAWILIKRLVNAINAPSLIDETKLSTALSVPFDELRQLFFEETRKILSGTQPPNFFKNQARVNSLLRVMLNRYFSLDIDSNEELKKEEQNKPNFFIEYLAKLAPQINLNE